MDINYELYKVFYHVASTLSFSEASKQLFISQSAVSQSIKTLERKLDQVLFIRSTKKVQLTPEGEILLRHIEPAMHLIQRGESQLLDAASTGGQIRIGASDTICRYFLVPYLKKFHEAFPNAHIKVVNQTSIKCVELLESGQVDLIVVNYPNSYLSNVSSIKKIKKFHDVFIANQDFAELKGKKLSYQELSKYPILMLDKHSTTSEYLHRLFQQHQLDLVPEIELTSNDLLIDLARIGLGIAFIPNFCLSEQTCDLFAVQTEEELPERELVIAYNEQVLTSKAAKEFLSFFDRCTITDFPRKSVFLVPDFSHFPVDTAATLSETLPGIAFPETCHPTTGSHLCHFPFGSPSRQTAELCSFPDTDTHSQTHPYRQH